MAFEKPQTINVVLIGERGVGKSSIVNLIAQEEIATVSSDASGGTVEYQRHEISFDDMEFAIFDTAGLEEPEMGDHVYSNTMEKAYELIKKLRAAGGIHILLFCMRGGKIKAATQRNYRSIHGKLHDTTVALVFTGLEREPEMEDWWKRNGSHVKSYGLESDGHACITAVLDDSPKGKEQYTESQTTIRELLKTCVHKRQTSPVSSPSLETPPQTMNVILFGETGVGKSSVVNLIAQKEITKVSSDIDGGTMRYNSYDVSFDNMNFAIFDTVGLDQPHMAGNEYLKAIEKVYELIVKLGAAGGIHLLLFCLRGGRLTATAQSNYRLFCNCLCNTKVPIALVFTGLEREVQMENWWTRNKAGIEGYGLKSDGHACITAVQNDTPEGRDKYTESQATIRELLKTCTLKGEAFSPELHSQFARTAMRMQSFLPAKKSPKKKDVMKVLTQHCKLDANSAKRIAQMMEKGDA